eukprot:CAMPEP_0172323620 /NCGR_PEP_ID=MMETSP1058-20130122/49237_1 /TAXON_ID=83371 /ORGANISM="Detonula confervacea, Strain CCMP 353" /LENGTH=184 /DNA_ID=CAMNT_0013039673 /DNA_START=293 /DNA_END=844 /DNA_ORIENTATION=+
MPAKPFRSKLIPTQLNRASSMPVDEDENNAIHVYKQCLEEVKRDNPCLSIGAQQQMALKQCAKLNEVRDETREHSQKRFSAPEDLLNEVLSKLNIGKSQGSCENGIGSTCSSIKDSTDGKKERLFAICKSVVISEEEQNRLAQMAWSEGFSFDRDVVYCFLASSASASHFSLFRLNTSEALIGR